MAEKHILIVDKELASYISAAEVLKTDNCRISFAQGVEMTFEILDQFIIDLVLLDVSNSELDGPNVFQGIHENPKFNPIPIIILYERTDNSELNRALQLGVVDFIAKPIIIEELLCRIRAQLKFQETLKTISEQELVLEKTRGIKDKFLSIIAHDLRNPFNGLLVLADILRYKYDRLKPDQIKEMINLIYLSTKDGCDLLENLLEWSRAQRDKLEFKPIEINVNRLIAGNVQLIRPMASAKNIELQTPPDEKVSVVADQHMIDTVIRNLITNAVKFTEDHGMVKVSVEEQNDQVILCVQDSGIGISEKKLTAFFENDGSESSIGTANEKGTGLGLLLCKEFIERHQGKIWVESQVGIGSTFKFSIPTQV